ncbi:MAG: NUDIX hydrolase [Novosphingobium sp.]|nr:NUDIX hydrolase [Novosphingobium sp.]
MSVYHPRKDENGKLVTLAKPSQPSPLEAWEASDQVATVIPDGPLPKGLNTIPFCSWSNLPTSSQDWELLVDGARFDEPDFIVEPGKKPASGVVLLEPDGRVWAVSPSNQFGGYTTTFPKGSQLAKEGLSTRANAIKEAYEESGLRVELTGFLIDVSRSTSFTRYYVGRRISGSPADMGWESQAVHLIPRQHLTSVINHKNDAPILKALSDLMVVPS